MQSFGFVKYAIFTETWEARWNARFNLQKILVTEAELETRKLSKTIIF